MKIRKIEVQGFKSFVDRCVIGFEWDVTAIVGPNGCGKSNTVDAIRWCMGEQSARHLRGKSMDDVIFAGSDSRPPASFAEVTLVFDNRDGLAPPEFSAYSEIAVTRRLTRDGGSDYFLNRVPVRLMDVTGLFLGTGAGTKAYSIVEQGRIGLIVTSKPEDRRLLLEEAAGITRYKARKKVAEKKIELTRANLLRVGDLLGEIDKSLSTLKRQAQKAEKYKAAKAELRDLELYLATHQLLELLVVSRHTQAARAEAEEADHVSRHALAEVESRLEGERRSLFDVEQAVNRLQRESYQADNELLRLEGEIQRRRDRLSSARRRGQEAAREIAELSTQHETLRTESAALAEELARLDSDERGSVEALAEAEEAVREHRERLGDADKRLSGLRDTVLQAERALAAMESQRNAVSRRIIDVHGRRSKVENEAKGLRKRLTELSQEQLGSSETLARLAAEREELKRRRMEAEGRIEPLRAKRKSVETALGTQRLERDRLSARLGALRELSSRHEGVGRGVQAVLAHEDYGRGGLVLERLQVPPEWTSAVAAVLGDRWQDVAVSELSLPVEALRWLRTGKQGRVAFGLAHALGVVGSPREVPRPEVGAAGGRWLSELVAGLDSAPEYVRGVLSETVAVETLEEALVVVELLRGSALQWRVVTREGDVLERAGRVVGGAPEKAGAGLLSTQSELRALEPQVREASERVRQAEGELEGLVSDLQSAQREAEELRADLHAQELAVLSAERDLKAHEAEQLRSRARSEQVEKELAELDREFDAAEAEELALESSYGEASARRARSQESLFTEEQELQAWRVEAERATHRLTDAKVVAARARERASGVRNAVHRIERSSLELQQREQRLGAEVQELAHVEGAALGDLLRLGEQSVGAKSNASSLKDELGKAQRGYDEARRTAGDLEVSVRQLRSKKDACGKTLTALELKAREEALALEHLLQGIAERHSVVLTHIVSEYHLRPPPGEPQRRRVEELRGQLDRMGEVNLTAIDELAAQEKRHLFFTEQRSDLERALKQLQDAIGQMDRESKKRFQETFEAVNQHFQTIFPRLFRGGQGRLQLSNPADMLESGVEIVAQPPGKKLVNLEAMSGGEKTLTAVTLIFALFMYRPSPFCLLDEVEAALDEANVIRLCELIRDLTDRSQFIMITHNKRTMAMADVLYGVTMEEPGVSKLVGVRLKRAEESSGAVA